MNTSNSEIIASELRCNACWKVANGAGGQSYRTRCSHLFCETCARAFFGRSLVCPVCDSACDGETGILRLSHSHGLDALSAAFAFAASYPSDALAGAWRGAARRGGAAQRGAWRAARRASLPSPPPPRLPRSGRRGHPVQPRADCAERHARDIRAVAHARDGAGVGRSSGGAGGVAARA
jgi:hypothetical protein